MTKKKQSIAEYQCNIIAYAKFNPAELFNKGILVQNSTVVTRNLSYNNEVSLRHAFIFCWPMDGCNKKYR